MGAARVGGLGAGALLASLAVMSVAQTAGSPAGAHRTERLRPINGWDEASLRWLTPVLGSAKRPARRLPAQIAVARRTAIVRQMFQAGDRIARLPYRWGGGHGSFADSGYDCSGSVSYLLHAGGLLAAPEASGDLTAYGEPGPGHRVTVYANAEHALVTLDGRRFDTITLRETGSRWSPRVGSLSGYVMRHPLGL